MKTYMTIGKVAKELGVSICTLRRWDKLGKLTAAFRTLGGHRRYLSLDVFKLKTSTQRLNIGYARVSSHVKRKIYKHRFKCWTTMQVKKTYKSFPSSLT